MRNLIIYIAVFAVVIACEDKDNNKLSWTLVRFQDTTLFAIEGRENVMMIGSHLHGLFYSADNGISWNSRSDGMAEPFVESVTFDSSGNLFAIAGPVIYKSTNQGLSWFASKSVGGSSGLSDLGTAPSGTLFATFERAGISLLRSTDNGVTWDSLRVSDGLRRIAFSSTNRVFVGDRQGNPIQSDDEGSTWNPVNLLGIDDFSFISETHLLAVGYANAGVFLSTNAGLTWNEVSDVGGNGWLRVLRVDENTAVAGGNFNPIILSSDQGQTWESIGIVPGQVFDLYVDYSGYVFAATSNGLYRSSQSLTE